ncbi:MAG TPA: futalosine hydrolase [Vicinamibacterales bacterium]|nr:futalosine hydrolase [Vicinamibacterales bacterium]
MPVDFLVCVATELECTRLRERLPAEASSIAILRTGVGPVNAAHAVTWFLAREQPTAIVVCGVGGAYPGSGLQVGDVVCAGSECYGDLGAASPSGFLDMKALGFPVVEGSPPLYNVLPMQRFPASRRVPFVTMSTCTGTHGTAIEVEQRTGGAVENMEGAAIAHVAHLHGIPVGEVRGISNIVTDRDTRRWKLDDASRAAQEALAWWIGRR